MLIWPQRGSRIIFMSAHGDAWDSVFINSGNLVSWSTIRHWTWVYRRMSTRLNVVVVGLDLWLQNEGIELSTTSTTRKHVRSQSHQGFISQVSSFSKSLISAKCWNPHSSNFIRERGKTYRSGEILCWNLFFSQFFLGSNHAVVSLD